MIKYYRVVKQGEMTGDELGICLNTSGRKYWEFEPCTGVDSKNPKEGKCKILFFFPFFF